QTALLRSGARTQHAAAKWDQAQFGTSDTSASDPLPVSGVRNQLGEPANHSNHFALDLDVARIDRLHGAARRLQPHAILLLEEALQRRAVVLEQRDDDVAVPGGALLLHDDEIAVVDVVVDHRLPANAQNERVATAPGELAGDGHRFALVFERVDRLAGGDLPDDRRRYDAAAKCAGDGERPRTGGVFCETAFLLELGEVVVDRRRRGEPDGLGDLAHCRRVTPLRDALPNESEDSFRSLLVLLSHVSTIPNICSPVNTALGAVATEPAAQLLPSARQPDDRILRACRSTQQWYLNTRLAPFGLFLSSSSPCSSRGSSAGPRCGL